ncbi:hypothetical protein PR048_026434 [Dryococelus australis]|uniref:Integrase catalytic domain-containing protein n=1 Tax=Dryococelus australis TaxID=614101 RepID=A0ABQ9GLB4_9NEOP|nr:hypothetical protein PR048_026434 [Dryococelus australis]
MQMLYLSCPLSKGVSDPLLGAIDGEDATYLQYVGDSTPPETNRTICHETIMDPLLTNVIRYILYGWPKEVPDNMKPFWRLRNQLTLESGLSFQTLVRANCCKNCTAVIWVSQKMKSLARAELNNWETLVQNVKLLDLTHPPLNPNYENLPLDLGRECTSIFWASAMLKSLQPRLSIPFVSQTHSWLGLLYASDNGPLFTLEVFQTFIQIRGINHVTSPPHQPPSNEQAESNVQVFKYKRKSLFLSGGNMSEKLFQFLRDVRTATHCTTGQSPAQLMFGRNLRNEYHYLCSTGGEPRQQHIPTTLAGTVRREFQTGDAVRVCMYNGRCKWMNGTVVAKEGAVVYRVQNEFGQILRRHVNQMVSSNLKEIGEGGLRGIAGVDGRQEKGSSKASELVVQEEVGVENSLEEITGKTGEEGREEAQVDTETKNDAARSPFLFDHHGYFTAGISTLPRARAHRV